MFAFIITSVKYQHKLLSFKSLVLNELSITLCSFTPHAVAHTPLSCSYSLQLLIHPSVAHTPLSCSCTPQLLLHPSVALTPLCCSYTPQLCFSSLTSQCLNSPTHIYLSKRGWLRLGYYFLTLFTNANTKVEVFLKFNSQLPPIEVV